MCVCVPARAICPKRHYCRRHRLRNLKDSHPMIVRNLFNTTTGIRRRRISGKRGRDICAVDGGGGSIDLYRWKCNRRQSFATYFYLGSSTYKIVLNIFFIILFLYDFGHNMNIFQYNIRYTYSYTDIIGDIIILCMYI